MRTRLAREQRREQIVDAAAELFRTRDANEVTFEEIAEAAGVSRALVYNYFGDRDGLIEAVYSRHLARLRERASSVFSSAPTLELGLRALVQVHLEFAHASPDGYRYAAGEVNFAGLAGIEDERVRRLAQGLGGGPEAELRARGLLSALHAMVLYWIDHPGLDERRAGLLIGAFLVAAMHAEPEGPDGVAIAGRAPAEV